MAVGDEEGCIRLLDSDGSGSDSFSKIHLSFPVHGNAIMDLAFSEHDSLLATASGDQTAKITDMKTQLPLAVLGHHTALVKRVVFQPGKAGGNILATSSRDGSIQIWDLRCRGPVNDFLIERDSVLGFRLPRKINQGCVVNSMYSAHRRTTRQTRQAQAASADTVRHWETPGRTGEVSVTALQFLPPGKEHLLLSACEADASIKLWDIRSIHTSRQKTSTPVSFTAPPSSHVAWRPFGISSLSLGADGARLYGVCKDNTVYAYATSHLILGRAPELSFHGEPPRPRNGPARAGAGPLYGFRHDAFHATSFYVKAAVRPARDGRSELLAVGSSDGCPVLFPTDERYYFGDGAESDARGRGGAATTSLADSGASQSEGLFLRATSSSAPQGRPTDDIPILRTGTPLVRGHDKEVGALGWTAGGRLATLGDDYFARCWREDRGRAADLRSGGEGEGRRWHCGWADIGSDWDEDDE